MSYSQQFNIAFKNKDCDEMVKILLMWNEVWKAAEDVLEGTKCEFEDMKMEVIINIFTTCQRNGKFKFEGQGKLASLLKTAVIKVCFSNKGRNKYRGRHPIISYDEPGVLSKLKDRFPLIDEDYADKELKEIIRVCINEMSPCCQVVLDGYGNHYTQKEIFKKHKHLLISCGVDTMHKLRHKTRTCLDKLGLCVASKTDNF